MTFGVIFSVFTLALLGGVHCAAMCGGIALAAEQSREVQLPPTISRSPGAWLRELLAMHLGRLCTYMLLGAILGAVGATVWKQQYLPLQRWLFGAGSGMLIVSGLWLLRGSTFRAAWLERVAARGASLLVRHLGAVASRLPSVWRRRGPITRRFGLGLAWGLVPCGMVYGALSLALLAGSASSGAVVMGAFGLGTLPNLLVLSGLSGYLRGLSRRPAVRTGAALVVMAFGALGVYRAAFLPHSLAESGFCLVF